MNKNHKIAIDNELLNFKKEEKSKKVDQAWTYLERAHVLGQGYWFLHVKVHIYMLLYAFKTKNFLELFAQIPRILLAAPGSIFNKAPIGNVGTGRVGIFKEMTIPQDLKEILDKK